MNLLESVRCCFSATAAATKERESLTPEQSALVQQLEGYVESLPGSEWRRSQSDSLADRLGLDQLTYSTLQDGLQFSLICAGGGSRHTLAISDISAGFESLVDLRQSLLAKVLFERLEGRQAFTAFSLE